MNIFLAVCHCNECMKVFVKETNWQGFAIIVALCLMGAVVIYKICNTIVRLVELNHTKKEETIKRLLEDVLENDCDIINLLKQKIDSKGKNNE